MQRLVAAAVNHISTQYLTGEKKKKVWPHEHQHLSNMQVIHGKKTNKHHLKNVSLMISVTGRACFIKVYTIWYTKTTGQRYKHKKCLHSLEQNGFDTDKMATCGSTRAKNLHEGTPCSQKFLAVIWLFVFSWMNLFYFISD